MPVQALLRDLLESPYGQLRQLQRQPVSLFNFFASVEQTPMASASIAQVNSLPIQAGLSGLPFRAAPCTVKRLWLQQVHGVMLSKYSVKDRSLTNQS